jgi:mono/diheme cytochrome c family protein
MTFKIVRTGVALLVIAAFVLIFSHLVGAAENNGTLQGVVKDSFEKPVTGAFVRLKNSERHLTFLVISQADGRYTAGGLPPGQYTVQGIGGGFQSVLSPPVDVTSGKDAKFDVSLKAKRGPRLLPAWPMKMPEAQLPLLPKELPEGDGKKIVAARCTVCHDAARFMAFHMDRERWQDAVRGMRANMRGAKLHDLTDEEAKTVIDYLSANFPPAGPPDLNSRLPRFLLEGKAMRYRVVQYDISDTNQNAEPHDVAVDPHGNGWVGQRIGRLGRLESQYARV